MILKIGHIESFILEQRALDYWKAIDCHHTTLSVFDQISLILADKMDMDEPFNPCYAE